MPPLRRLPALPQLFRLPPIARVAFPDVPRVQFNHQRERFDRPAGSQLRHELIAATALTHLLIPPLPLGFGTLALPPRFPIQRRARQLHPRQPLDHRAGLGHRQLAHRQRRHLLHAGRTAPGFGQTQPMIRRKKPPLTPPTPSPRPPNRHRAKARLVAPFMPVAHTAQAAATHRTDRRSLIRLLLRRLFQHGPLGLPALPLNFFLQMAHRLVTGLKTPVQAGRQAFLPDRQGLRKHFETAVGLRNRFHAAVRTHASFYHPTPRLAAQNVRCSPQPAGKHGAG